MRQCDVIGGVRLAVCGLWVSVGFAALAQPTSIPAPRAVQVLAGDFNGDGKPDLLIQQLTNSPSGMLSISVFPGKGDGTFSTPVLSYTPWTVLTTADFNGDGKLDLVLNGGDQQSYIALGNGDGTFRTGQHDVITVVGSVIGVADFNGDGKRDLLTVLPQNNGYAILFGAGDGTFTVGGGFSSNDVLASHPMLLGDLNLDGKADVVTTSLVLLSNGDGTFREVPLHPGEGLAGPGVLADLNGDGIPDIIYILAAGSDVVWAVLFGNGDGTFRPGNFGVNDGRPSGYATTPSNPVVADFDQDGALEAAFVSPQYGLTILQNYGDGTQLPPSSFTPGFPYFANYMPGPFAVADFNGDGKPDVAVIDQPTTGAGTLGPTEVTVLLNSNPLRFPLLLGGVVNAASSKPVPLSPGSLASAYTLPQSYKLQVASSLPLPLSLEKAELQLNENPVPLLAISSQQINFQVPWELAGASTATISFEANPNSADLTTYRFPFQPGWEIHLATFSPGIFTMTGLATGQGAVTIANSSALTAPVGAFPGSRPASRREYITIFGTGLGPVENQPASGSPALAKPLSTTKFQPTVTIGDAAAVVQFSGLAPGFVGVNQINVQVPANAPTGDAVQLVIQTADGSHSNAVTIAIK